MHPDVKQILFSQEEIAKIVAGLGKQIHNDYQGKSLLVVGVLNGAVFFTTDLVRVIDLPCQLDFVGTSSYGNGVTSGAIRLTKDCSIDPKGKDVLLVEDVLDTGKTLQYLQRYYKEKGAASVAICAMLEKPSAHIVAITADYIGATVGDEFVVGYGLDYAQQYRNLPYIGILKPEVYNA